MERRAVVKIGLVGLCAVLAGCRHRGAEEPRSPPVCARRLPEHLAHKTPETLPANEWLALFFKGYRDRVPAHPVDCLGEPIEWHEVPSDCEASQATGVTRRVTLSEDTLVIRHAGGAYWYAWAPFRELDNGMVEGPLAVARVHKERLEFRAVGTLRAFPTRPRFEVRRLGTEHVLVAEGERCASEGPCERGTRLMWLDRQRFRPRPLRSASVRRCLGPAWFPETEALVYRLNGHWQRELIRNTALAFEEGQIHVDEHILVHDRDLERESQPPRIFREAQAKIVVRVEEGELLAEGQSLWSSIRKQDGSTQVEAKPVAERATP